MRIMNLEFRIKKMGLVFVLCVVLSFSILNSSFFIPSFSIPLFAANEIRAFAPGVTNAYTVVREIDLDVWYIAGNTFEVWGGGVGRTMADYDITLVDGGGDMFGGSMDTNIPAGNYYLLTFQQAGGAPVDTDPAIWQEYGDWDGTTWIPATITVAGVWNALTADYGGAGTYGQAVEDIVEDTNEIQTDQKNGGRLDVIWDAIKYKTDLITLCDTVVKDANDANNFTIEDGTDVNDAYWFMAIIVEDADDNNSKEIRWIDQYDENSGDPNVWVDKGFSFTPTAGDVVHIIGTCYGGWLFDIMTKLDQTRGITNIINNTRSGAGVRSSVGVIEDEDYSMPGWP